MPAPETPSAPVPDERVRGHRSGTRAILADRIGDKRTLAIGASLLPLGVLPLFLWLDASRSTMTLVLVQSAFGLMVSSFTGVAPKASSGLFPTAVRTTGVSLVYNTAITVFGGFAPAILTWLTQSTSGSVLAPARYVVGGRRAGNRCDFNHERARSGCYRANSFASSISLITASHRTWRGIRSWRSRARPRWRPIYGAPPACRTGTSASP